MPTRSRLPKVGAPNVEVPSTRASSFLLRIAVPTPTWSGCAHPSSHLLFAPNLQHISDPTKKEPPKCIDFKGRVHTMDDDLGNFTPPNRERTGCEAISAWIYRRVEQVAQQTPDEMADGQSAPIATVCWERFTVRQQNAHYRDRPLDSRTGSSHPVDVARTGTPIPASSHPSRLGPPGQYTQPKWDLPRTILEVPSHSSSHFY